MLPLRQTDHPQFFRIANYYRSQTDPFTCGPVSGAIVLNALRHRTGFPHTWTSFLNERAQSIRSLAQIYDPARPGLSCAELRAILETAHDLHVDFASGAELFTLKRRLVEALATRDHFVIVNFSREVLGQSGGGHFSPLGAYDEASDSFFVLDTNPAVSPWAWIPAEPLCRAMATQDGGEYRGALIVSA